MSTHPILALDLGSNMGWALVSDGLIIGSGVVPLHHKDSHPGDRFMRFHNWLVASIKDNNVREIFYEDVPRFESAAAARVYCGLLAVVQMLCLSMGLLMTCIKPGSVKKEFAGTGNADKTMMCKTAHAMGWQHGHPSTDIDHDEADAIALAWVILQRRGVEAKIA